MTTETMRRSLGWKYGTVCVESMGACWAQAYLPCPADNRSALLPCSWHDEPERSSLDNLTAALRGVAMRTLWLPNAGCRVPCSMAGRDGRR